MIESDSDFCVIATAGDGVDALDILSRHTADIITLDVEMPRMDGLETLRQFRKRGISTPVVVVSSVTRIGSQIAVQCLEAGAIDIVRKPESYVSMDIHKISADLIWKLKAATQAKNPFTIFSRLNHLEIDQPQKKPLTQPPDFKLEAFRVGMQRVITIGSSTGGPLALQTILSKLPSNLPAGLVIVQHMPPGNFIYSLADRLKSYTSLEVRVAVEGDEIKNGLALIAPIGKHTIFRPFRQTYKIQLTRFPKNLLHCPAADVLFESAGKVIGSRNISCILTGMGADGSQGLEHVHQNRGYTIAESEETCVVYGMPRSAVEAGVVDKSLPIHKIAQKLQKLL